MVAITYKGVNLTRFKEKSGGKNNSPYDGFYEEAGSGTEAKARHFIKKPADQRELFAEAFAGAILNEIMERGLIDEIYHPSLIVADVVAIPVDDSGKVEYALIQPMVSFTEVFKDIGTGYANNSDRDPLKEAYDGPNYYLKLLQDKQFGLSVPLMFSLWLSAHSVHSGNMVTLKNDNMVSKQRARLDWGDAFRNLAKPKNNEQIWRAAENDELFGIRGLTKGYFLNYKKITGLFPRMAEQGLAFQRQLKEGELEDIIRSALARLPADLVDDATKKQFADYIGIPEFAQVALGAGLGVNPKVNPGVAQMAAILAQRLDKITQLQDLTAPTSSVDLYASQVSYAPRKLSIQETDSFPSLAEGWHRSLAKITEFDLSALDLAQLAKSFNAYMQDIAEQCEQKNIWQHLPETSANIFAELNKAGVDHAIHGHAFVPQYKEGIILQRLFTISPQTIGSIRFAAYEGPSAEYYREHPNSAWGMAQDMALAGMQMIRELALLQRGQFEALDELTQERIPRIKEQLDQFVLAKAKLQQLLEGLPPQTIPAADSSFFYAIDEQALTAMSAMQLATICFEELNAAQPSPLIVRILKNEALWTQVEGVLASNVFGERQDDIKNKIAKLHTWHQLLAITNQMHEQQSLATAEEHQRELGEVSTALVKTKSDLENALQLGVQVVQLKEQLQADEETISELKRQQRQERADFERKKQLSEQQSQKQEAQLKQLTQEMDALNERLQKDIAAKDDELGVAQKQMQTLNNEIERLTAQIEQAGTQYQALVQQHEQSMQEFSNELAGAKESHTQAEQKVSALAEQLKDVQENQLVVAAQKIQELEHSLNQEAEANRQLQQQLQANEHAHGLLVTREKQLSEQVVSLTEQLGQHDEQHQKALEQEKITRLNAEAQMVLLTEQIVQLNETLDNNKETTVSERNQAAQKIKELEAEINGLKIQQAQNEQQHQISTEQQAEQIRILGEDLDKATMAGIQAQAQLLQRTSELNDLKEKQLPAAQQNIATLKQQINQNTLAQAQDASEIRQLREQLKQAQEGRLAAEALVEKFKTAPPAEAGGEATPPPPTSAPQKAELEAKQAELDKLQKEMSALKTQYASQQQRVHAFEKLAEENARAQAGYDDALKNKQDVRMARTLLIAPVIQRIQALDEKARELNQRKETTAFDTASTLVRDMKRAVDNYINSEKNDADALTEFKTVAPKLIQAAEQNLGEHRKTWKVVLANLALATVMVGVGYLAAILVNRVVSKRFAFFAETDSHHKLKQLQKDIVDAKPTPGSAPAA